MASIGVYICVSLLQLLIFVKLNRNTIACYWRTSQCYIFMLFPLYILIFHCDTMLMLILFLFVGTMCSGLCCGCFGGKCCFHFYPEDEDSMYAETLGTQLTSTRCQHPKTGLAIFPVTKLTWQPYRFLVHRQCYVVM